MLKYKRSSSTTTQGTKSTKAPPNPIKQTKISLSYNYLTQIPTNHFPNTILHIYISHNDICSLSGIQAYQNLQSLNVSYNFLQRKEQLVQLLPSSLRKLSINQNKYPYGIEDYIIQKLPQLQRLNDQKLPSIKIKNHRLMGKNYIADNILNALIKHDRLLTFMKNYKQQIQVGLQISQQQISLNLLYENISQEKISKLGAILTQDPSNNKDSFLNKISNAIEIFNSVDLLCICRPYNFIQLTRHHGQLILDKILVRFANRNNRTLKNQLIRISEQKKLQTSNSLITAFKELNGDKLSLNTQPGKYIQQIDMRKFVKNHQLNNFMQKSVKQLKPLSYHQINKQNIQEIIDKQKVAQQQVLMQRIPMFIYQNNYIEVIYEIIKEQTLQLIKIFDAIHNLVRKKSIQKKRQDKQLYEEDIQTLKFANEKPLQKSVTFLQDNQKSHTQRKIPIQRKSILKSMGFQDATQKHTPETGKIQQIRKTVPLFQLGVNNIQKEKQQTKKEAKQDQNKNLQKYSLHEINLIYKVLRSFKKYTKKMQRKRQKILD